MHHRNPRVQRVRVKLPLKLSHADEKWLEGRYGLKYVGYGDWWFSEIEDWTQFENDIAKFGGQVVDVIKNNPLGETLVIAGANPRKRDLRKPATIGEIADALTEVLEDRAIWGVRKDSPLYFRIEWAIEKLDELSK